MFVWTSGVQNLLAHTHFDMFVDKWTSSNESPGGPRFLFSTPDPEDPAKRITISKSIQPKLGLIHTEK